MKFALFALLAIVAVVRATRVPPVALYIDITARPDLVAISKQTGIKAFKLAFALGGYAGCDKPMWGGTLDFNDARIMKTIKEFKAAGGTLVVSTGGAAGPYLESLCGTPQALAGAYKKVLDGVGTNHLDVDLEATVPTDNMNAALALLQRERPATTVSFTLMVQGDDYGVTNELGYNVLKNAASHGVRVDIVNPMTMEFGSSRPDWGDAVIAAAQATLGQMKTIWTTKSDGDLKKMLGVTPMIGRNFNGKIFTQAHAHKLVSWAQQNHVGQLSFWSVGRDKGCPGGGVKPDCSGIAQSDFEFSKIFLQYQG